MKTKNLVGLGSALLILCFCVCSLGTVSAQDEIRSERVHFKPGTSGAAIDASLTGYETVDYLLNVHEGQIMSVTLKKVSGGMAYFNIMEPGETEVAVYNSSNFGNEFEARLMKTGDYKIRVYQNTAGARRNTVAKFHLDVKVTGAAKK